ncbi:hypothetical protein [Actinomadura litoris]|uniref:Uncharacterized protein n=1 Tax=Actinomadura litoris TaxID=2678616 RepID=A0A7K1LAI0_9ACTN|nr:hypothetical protein [Actinomadura litoris]MUN41432.1 hypothetical protein [Actinomadura litoris]
MDNWIKLIEAIAKLIGSFAWPLAVLTLVIFILKRHRDAVDSVFARMTSLTLPGGIEMSMEQKLAEQEQQVIEAAERVAEAPPNEREPALQLLVEETDRHRRLQELSEIINNTRFSEAIRQKALDGIWALDIDTTWRGEEIRTIEQFDKMSAQKGAIQRRIKKLNKS